MSEDTLGGSESEAGARRADDDDEIAAEAAESVRTTVRQGMHHVRPVSPEQV